MKVTAVPYPGKNRSYYPHSRFYVDYKEKNSIICGFNVVLEYYCKNDIVKKKRYYFPLEKLKSLYS